MTKFMSAVVLLALLPIAVGVIIHFPDVYTYLTSGQKAEVTKNMLSWKVGCTCI